MASSRRPADDLIDVARVLLLLQGSILIATTIEALIWSAAFAGAAGTPVWMSGATAAAVLVARARLRPERVWARRLVFVVEGVTLTALAIDTALAILITGALPPVVALLTRLLLPLSVIVLLRRSARATAALVPSTVAAPQGAS